MVHCHNLQHEDKGMMGTVEIEGADGAVFDANCVSKSGFNYTDANSTSRIGASFCCSSKNDVPLISGLASAGAVVLLCAIAFGVRRARAGREASDPKRRAEVSDADADPQVKAPDL